jgi:curved DNA-binding protein CbpA
MNPYLLLGVPRDASDQAIRQAYLNAVKEATPETDPERFKAVNGAYEQIKDQTSRRGYELFHSDSPGESPLAVFAGHVRFSPKPAPLSFEAMKEFLRACSKT